MDNSLLSYLAESGREPVDYVLSKFETHDIVFLGEMHGIKQQLYFYKKLIPCLLEKDITIIAYEFARREDQPLIDELINKPEFDEQLAKTITIKQEALWGYQEYLDVFKIIWSINKKKPPSRRLKLLGLNDPINWKLYNYICNKEGRQPNPEEIKEIWKGCGEEYWADKIRQNYTPGRTKILGIMGSHHAFTKYREPELKLIDDKKIFAGFKTIRFGNHLHRLYREKLYNICFYDPWDSISNSVKSQPPAGGIIERIISPHYKEIGFDLVNSPWGELQDNSIYSLGYYDFRLKQIFDGMIFTGKLEDLKPITPIPDFINENNINLFREYSPSNIAADKNIEEINAMICRYADFDVEE